MPVITGAGQKGGYWQSVKRTLTAAEIISVWTTPITLVPAQGANTIIFAGLTVVRFTPGNVQFTGGAPLMLVVGSLANSNYGLIMNVTQIVGASNTFDYINFTDAFGDNTLQAGIDPTQWENQALTLQLDHTALGAAAYAAGNGSLVVSVDYELVLTA